MLARVLPITLVAIISTACSITAMSDACEQSRHRTEIKRTTIQLRGSAGVDPSSYWFEMKFDSPQYYFLPSGSDFIVFMDPKDVADLETTDIDHSGPNSSAELLALIRADQPIERNTDLNKYWVDSYSQLDIWLQPRFVVAAMLMDGKASVFDTVRKEFISSLDLVQVFFEKDGGGRWEYCAGPRKSLPVFTVFGVIV